MAIELVKENIEYDQLLGENISNTLVKEEYIIPDTQPDVVEILLVDAKPSILNKEVMQDKVYLEGQVEFDVLYLGKIEEKTEVCGVSYSSKFTSYIDIAGAEYKMMTEAECHIEHINSDAVNERKIALEGIIQLKAIVYKQCDIDIVKDVAGLPSVQFLKNPTTVEKFVGTSTIDLVAKSHNQIPSGKPQISNILKCDVNVHKKQVKLFEGKIVVEAFAEVNVLYKGNDNRELQHIFDDVLFTQETELEGVTEEMKAYADFNVDAIEYNINTDEMGENRNLDVEILIKVEVKVKDKVDIDVIEDAYSPELSLNIKKQEYDLSLMYGQSSIENMVKENIDFKAGQPNPISIVLSLGKVSITDKKIVDDKVVVDGIIQTSILYNTEDEEKYLSTLNEDIPFSATAEIAGCKIEMNSIAKAFLESIEASIEANTISIKAIVSIYCKVNYSLHKEFLIDVVPEEGEKPTKKASVTIYSAQAGDTLWKIAKRYNTTIDSIVNINNIENPEYIALGQKFIIPGRAII